jgi:hypothetical protein
VSCLLQLDSIVDLPGGSFVTTLTKKSAQTRLRETLATGAPRWERSSRKMNSTRMKRNDAQEPGQRRYANNHGIEECTFGFR